MPPVVIVRPLSGYANRLQAIVSGMLMAEELGAELLVCWEESEVAPVPASAVLGPAWCAAHVVSAPEVHARYGVDPTRLPPYLTREAGVVTLAGLDRGEQAFMPGVRDIVSSDPDLSAIVLSAGGKFTLLGDAVLTEDQARAFRQRRAVGYADLPLNPAVEAGAAVASSHMPFVGLHLRYSDRSAETPWPSRILPALEQIATSAGVRSVFVASDTAAQRERWFRRVADAGLTPWTADPGDFPRSDPRSALGALVDWRVLTRSDAMVYFAASSYAEEASVASGHFDQGIGLTATATRTAWVRAGQYVEAARTYPRRHGWLRRP